jgi:hypothetical protein
METISLSEAQIHLTISKGEFPDDIINSEKNVAVIMTQSWCPQWMMMSLWLKTISVESSVNIYSIIYDKEPYFNEFMTFKENVFGNRQVPYVRYYIDGKLVKETNYTSKDFFLGVFKK